MISSEKEKVAFHYEDLGEKPINPNDAGGCVEIWLDQIQNIKCKEVAQYDLTMKSYAEYEARRERTMDSTMPASSCSVSHKRADTGDGSARTSRKR